MQQNWNIEAECTGCERRSSHHSVDTAQASLLEHYETCRSPGDLVVRLTMDGLDLAIDRRRANLTASAPAPASTAADAS